MRGRRRSSAPWRVGHSASVRLEGRLLLLPEARRPEALAAELDSVPAEVLFDAGMMFLWVPDAHKTAVQLSAGSPGARSASNTRNRTSR